MLLSQIGPTSDAGKLHSLRVFHSTQAVLGNDLDPLKYGYYAHNGMILPKKMTIQPAPDYLLKAIR